MKNILNEELRSIKFLMKYDRNKILSEQSEEIPQSSPETSTTNVTDKPLDKVIDEKVQELCKTYPNNCQSCGDMMKKLPLGDLKDKDVEKCLMCKSKIGPEVLECNKLTGQILQLSNQARGERDKFEKGTSKVTTTTSIVTGLLLMFDNIKRLFQKDENENPN
jgi:hypothetical protein